MRRGYSHLGSINALNDQDGRGPVEHAKPLHDSDGWLDACDDSNGKSLQPGLAKHARMEELQYVKRLRVATQVPLDQCTRVTDKKPIGARLVYIRKRDDANP